MESDESCEGLVEPIRVDSDGTPGAIMTPNGVITMSPRSMKTEQIYQHCPEFQHESLVSCSSNSSNLVHMNAAAIGQNGQVQHTVMAVADPNNPGEQQLVVVQNMNGSSGIDEASAKSMINAGQMSNQIQMAKFNGNPTSVGMMQQIAGAPQMIGPGQLAGMMNLSGLPQVATFAGLNGVPGLNIMGQQQLVQQIQQQQFQQQQLQQQQLQQQQIQQQMQQQQMQQQQIQQQQQQQQMQQQQMQQQQQQQQNGGQQCVTNTQIQNGAQQNIVSVNGQPGVIQQPQVGNQPQFILAGGQPIQGIQGAQLLIPTSSGVATQQVITIPVSQLAGNQIVQLVASNGQIFTTTLANLQAMSQPVPVPGIPPSSNPQAMPPQQLIQPGFPANVPGQVGQIAALPQIFTNSAGQLVTLGPQIISHPMMNQNPSQLIAPQIQQVQQSEEKSPNMHSVSSTTQSPVANRIQNASLNAITQAMAMQQQQQAQNGQMAMNPIMVATHLISPLKNPTNPQNCIVAPKLTVEPGSTVSTVTQTVHPQPSVSPDDDCDSAMISAGSTINNTEANVVDGINLEEIKEFAKAFKIRRLSLGLTQTQVGQALSATEGPSYSQSAICRFEKLDITPRSAQKIKPVLERWMKEAEERYKNGAHTLTEFIGSEPTKKRKRRTSFTPAALDLLNQFFEKNTHPSGLEMTGLAEHLNYDREVVRVWFCNKRQALKNTIKKLKNCQ